MSRMVPLITVADAFRAHVIAARLKSEGIASVIRPEPSGIYPTYQPFEILIAQEDEARARETLLFDAVEAVFLKPPRSEGPGPARANRQALLAAFLCVVGVLGVVFLAVALL